MALSDYVTVAITQTSAGPTLPGFGVPLIPSYSATWTERTRTYNNLAGLATDFPVTTSPEYRAGTALFSQNPAPTTVMVGRMVNKPTKVLSLTANTPLTQATYTYTLQVRGQGFADQNVTFTSSGTPTDALWAAGIVTALNAVASKNYTAAGASSPVTITGNTAGAWFSVEVINPADMRISETEIDAGIAADLIAITAENPNWYGFGNTFNSKLIGVAAAGWIESNNRLFICQSQDTSTVLTAVGNADLIDTIKTNAYARSAGFYHPFPSVFADFAWMGKCLPYTPGSETWKFKTLATIPTFMMTSTHRTNIVARNGNSYESVAGLSMTFDGKVGSGNYIDVTRGLDALISDITTSVFGTLAGAPKVPYTDQGVAMIEAALRGALKRAVDKGILAQSPEFTVTTPVVANIATADKISRTLNNVFFTGKLAGAIHSANIIGTVSA
ncbi:MAG: DUF3383 family protein [Actinobacteria bacterium]|nr:DUF3383 family protein [Actinomycetota bacterium]